MPQPVLRIVLTDEERETLNAWSRSTAGEHRMVERSRVILLAAEGLPAREIARRLKTRLARVSKWRGRFCQDRLSRQALRNLSCRTIRQLREAIDRFVKAYRHTAAPFEWTKAVVQPSAPKQRCSDLCK